MEFDWKITHNDDGYLVTAPDDTILHANLRAQRFLGLSAATPPAPQRFRDTALRCYHCEPEDAWAGWPGSQGGSTEIRYLIRPETSDSPLSWLQVELSPRSPKTPHHRLIRLHDVTESVSATCRAWTLRSMISHKLKTPLTTLITCLEMMNLDRNLLSPEMRELVDLSRLSLNRLQQDVTEITQAGEQRSSPGRSPFRLAELPDLLDRLATVLQLRRVTVTGIKTVDNLSLPPSFLAMESIMTELLQNSGKFHPEHTPTVAVTVMRRDDGQLALQVSDDGAFLRGKQSLIPPVQGADGPAGEVSVRGRGLPMVAALVWESGGSFRLYDRDDVPGVVAEIILPIMNERNRQQGGSPCRT